MTLRNVFAIFLVSGFWHGANWTYMFWGFLHASLFIPLYMFDINRKNLGTVADGKYLPSIKDVFAMLLTFTLATIAWVFFRAESITEAFQYLGAILQNGNIAYQAKFFTGDNILDVLTRVSLFIPFLLFIEWFNRTKEYGSEFSNATLQKGISIVSIIIIFFYGKFDYQEFIYFQF